MIVAYLFSSPEGDISLDPEDLLRPFSEKHGILYHLASIEVFLKEIRTKFTLSTALSKAGIECLVREHDILDRLNQTFGFPFLPEVYGIREMACPTDQGTTEKLILLSAQWFEDYHEWHLAMDPPFIMILGILAKLVAGIMRPGILL